MTSIRAGLALLAIVLAGCGSNDGAPAPRLPDPPVPPVNSAPVAAIQPMTLTVDEGAAVTLDGSGSLDAQDGTALAFAWRALSGPAPLNPGSSTQPQFTFTAPQVNGQQVIVIELRVTDAGGLSDSTSAQVTVRDTTQPPTDQPPVADAGADTLAPENQTAVLDGSASSDAESGANLAHAWTQVDGPAVTLQNPNAAIASFVAPDVSAPTPLTFRLVVTDTASQSAADTTVVTVVPAPAAYTFFEGQCREGGGPDPLCTLLGLVETSQPDRLPVASYGVARGAVIRSAAAARPPSVKVIDGAIGDWIGTPSRIGGQARLDAGEWIYSDFVFDAYGADDGDDARRLALLDPLAAVEPRTFRFDQLFQAAGDQFDAPRPVGAPDRYGDALELDSETDLFELRLAAAAQSVYLLARFTTLTDASKPALLVLIDSVSGPANADVGFGTNLKTSAFDKAVLLTADGVQARDLATNTDLPIAGTAVAIDAAGWTNALEAALPASLFAGATRIAVLSAGRTESGLVPANVAFRASEPVAGVYSDKLQALSLLAGNVDAFATRLSLAALRAGLSETVVPGAGYHERQFVSGENIARESGESGLVQHYGLYVPTRFDAAAATPLTFWLHYRGGKAHSGAAWTPRLVSQLGEEQDNLVVTPRGRGTSTWYVTQAHQDFFEVFADVHALLPNIDPQRRYLSGYSMGGYGTYLFGLLYPDLFAGGYSTSGAMTQGLWTGVGPDGELCAGEQQDVPEVGMANLCFGEANDGDADAQLNYRILENARHFPIVIHHGTDDELVPISGVQRMGARLAELGYRYELATFFGYEHYTQAIIDEWADGAFYLNRFRAPVNPRVVSYTIVPALLRALNTVQARDVAFDFAPDGAYWVDALAVHEPDAEDPSQPGRIEAESFAIPEPARLAVPVAAHLDASASPPQVSAPVIAPGSHSTPFARHGIDWADGPAQETANAFRATLTRLAAATLDVQRMNLDVTRPLTGSVDSSVALSLTLAGIDAPVQVFVNGIVQTAPPQDGRIVLALGAGASVIEILPLGASAPVAIATGAPALDAACLAATGGDAAALCQALGAASAAFAGGCAELGGGAFCATFGGNLHGLIDACRSGAGNGGALACKLAEQFVFALASACRQQDGSPEICALISGELIGNGAIETFENGWTARALALQRALGEGLALKDAEFLSTHNSYNVTSSNSPPTLSGSDSNQKYAMPEQFRLGVRGLELDVHWWFSSAGSPATQGRAPLLCHGNVLHAGCSSERTLRAGLVEIRDWLLAHPGEVIVIDLEDHLDDAIDDTLVAHDAAAAALAEVLGPLLYTPASAGASCADGLPLATSRADIRAAGRQVIVYTGCGAGSAWPQLVWQRRLHTQSSISGLGAGTIAFPDSCVFTPEQYRDHWTRFYEDSTFVGAATGASRRTSAAEVRAMGQCGVNMPSLDQVGPGDERLPAFVWSWAPGEPALNASLDCARHGDDGRLASAACASPLPQACVDGAGNWSIGLPAAPWGLAACAPGSTAAAPRSSEQNERLKTAKIAAGVDTVWLAYREYAREGDWRAD